MTGFGSIDTNIGEVKNHGLEFDRVFISGMENGLFPRIDKIDDTNELEEERRLFFV